MKQSFNIDIAPVRYVKQDPYVGEDGIYVPIEDYVREGTTSLYRNIITKELFMARTMHIRQDPRIRSAETVHRPLPAADAAHPRRRMQMQEMSCLPD